MAFDINLIPQEEVYEQQKTQAVKFSTIISLVLLVVVASVSAYFFNSFKAIKASQLESQTALADVRAGIEKYSALEINVRNLNQKVDAISQFFINTPKYSLLLEELRARKPAGVNIKNIAFRGSKMELTGNADTYFLLNRFVNDLKDPKFVGGNEKLKALFIPEKVGLNSVNLDKERNDNSFNLVVEFNLALLTK